MVRRRAVLPLLAALLHMLSGGNECRSENKLAIEAREGVKARAKPHRTFKRGWGEDPLPSEAAKRRGSRVDVYAAVLAIKTNVPMCLPSRGSKP
jgi:hypothetical protein